MSNSGFHPQDLFGYYIYEVLGYPDNETQLTNDISLRIDQSIDDKFHYCAGLIDIYDPDRQRKICDVIMGLHLATTPTEFWEPHIMNRWNLGFRLRILRPIHNKDLPGLGLRGIPLRHWKPGSD